MFLGALLLTLTIARPAVLTQLDAFAYDLLLRTHHGDAAPSRAVIVDIDEKSLQELGQWPWPRYQMAHLLDTIRLGGAKVVAMDSVFAEPDRLSLIRLKERFSRDMNISIGLDGIAPRYLDNDAILGEALGHDEIVAGIWFTFDNPHQKNLSLLPLPRVVFTRTPDAPQTTPIPVAAGVLPPTPALLSKVRSAGFVNVLPDPDGKIRRTPLLIAYGDRIYPSLSLAAVMHAMVTHQVVGRISAAGIEEVQVGDIVIPTDRHGNLLLPFSTSTERRFESFSAADLLRGRVPSGRLRDKVVFIGSSATAQSDVHPTPLTRQMPGIYIHAVAADAILQSEFLTTPSLAPVLQAVLVLLFCAAMTFLLSRYPLAACTAVSVCGTVVLCLGAWGLLARGIFLSPVAPLCALGGSFTILGVIRFRGEEKAAIRSEKELSVAQDCAIVGLVSVAETRDPETGNHLLRTQHYVKVLAEQLARNPKFRDELTDDKIRILFKSAPLHDIGKVGVRDSILLKKGSFTEEEYVTMREHTVIGRETLERADRISGVEAKNSFFLCAEEIALAHHERWDGTGYPHGLRGEEIPLSARLMALADVYDALRCKRHYKEKIGHDEVVRDIKAASGTQFDPDVVQAFLAVERRFLQISEAYEDEGGQEGVASTKTLGAPP
ncbi:MAG TPA: CHASE2 domain-containing protein [Geobacteraceae bacterium]